MTTPSATIVVPAGRDGVQPDSPQDRLHRQELARAVNGLMIGRTNVTLEITLPISVAACHVIDSRISIQSFLAFAPLTAHAAAELASGAFYAVPANGEATINCNSTTDADRTFTMLMIG